MRQQEHKYQGLWRINRMDSPHRDRTGSRIVEASSEDVARDRVRSKVSRTLRRCPEDDVCVYSIKRVRA